MKFARWFLIMQAVGLVGIVIYLAARDSVLGLVFARIALVALLPGGLLGGRLVEWLLRPSSQSRETIQFLAVAAVFAINASVYFLIRFGVRLRAYHRAA